MEIGLRKLAEDDKRATPLVGFDQPPNYPPAAFKYSQLHINVIAHLSKYLGQQTAERFEQPFRISLRDDAPALDWNAHNIDWSDFNREHRQAGWSCAPPCCKSDTGLRALGSHAAAWAACIGRPAFDGLPRQDHAQIALRTSCRAPTGSPPLTISCHLALPKRTIQDGPARRFVTCRGGRTCTQIAPRSPCSSPSLKLQRRSS